MGKGSDPNTNSYTVRVRNGVVDMCKVIQILLICVCSFDLFCPLLERDRFIENLYIALFLTLFVSI